jgi:hypothetical protein
MKTFLYIITFLFLFWLQANLFDTSILVNASILIVTIILANKHLNDESKKKENEESLFLEEKHNHYLEQLESYSKEKMDIYEKQKFEDEYLDDSEIAYYKKERQKNK